MLKWTEKDKTVGRDLHKKLCESLGVKPTKIYFSDKKDPDGDFVAEFRHREKVNNIKMFQKRNKSVRCLIYLIAHETYHHYQNQKGWLGPYLYKNITKNHYDNYSYYRRPWERAAHKFANKILIIKGFEKLNISKSWSKNK